MLNKVIYMLSFKILNGVIQTDQRDTVVLQELTMSMCDSYASPRDRPMKSAADFVDEGHGKVT